MKTRPHHAFPPIAGRTGLAILAVLTLSACSDGGESGTSDESTTSGGTTGDGGQPGTGGVGGTSGSLSGGTGGTASDNTGGAAAGGTESGGGPSGTGNGPGTTGGVETGGASTGGAPATGGSATGGATTGGGGASTGGSDTGGGTGGGGESTGGAGTGGNATGGAGGAETGGATTSSGGTGGPTDTVTRSSSTYTFQHYPIATGADDVWNGPETPDATPTSTTFDTVVLENGYLRVTLLPDYGGRILSIVHKPTERELLYQNPLGTPYLMYEDIFYYDYLMILGGIFPSFPEPEHGKYWNQPYDFQVLDESPDAVTVRMSHSDDRDRAAGVPDRYDVGRTDVLVEEEVTLRAGSTSLELHTRLTNTRSTPVPAFEYWTVTTLAPGSPPGNTAIPLNTRILAAMEQVHLLESSWSWFGSAETRVSGEVFQWNNLSYFENWADQGTAFANPSYSANWSGCINYDNDMGTLRVSENVQTPGLKLWTFGKQSLDADLGDPDQWLRPTIEMWHGVTPEFWDRGTLAAGEVKQWSDHYFPTLGLREITAASEHGAVSLSRSASGADTVLSAVATLTHPDQTVHAVLRLGGAVVAEEDVVVAPAEPTLMSATVATSEITPGAVFEVEFLQGDSVLLSGQLTLS